VTEAWAREHSTPRLRIEAQGDSEIGVPSSTADAILDGRYRLLRTIGRGGMGQVYEARHLRLERRVAIKLLRAQPGCSKMLHKRFEREAQAAAQIEHERVVAVFDFGLAESGQPYLVMEYLDGKDLRSLLSEEGSLAAPRAVALLRDVCLGLEAAHAQGVIHRDIKPENLFVIRQCNGAEACKVLDFGLAKLKMFGVSDLHTASGLPLGTLHYMSPEQARGETDVDERTDVYGCAAVLYELLTGQRPHTAESPHALLHKITHERVRRIEEHGSWQPAGLADIIHRGLEPERALRPGSVQVFRQLLEPYLATRATSISLASSREDTIEVQPAIFSPTSAERRPLSGSRRGEFAGYLILTALVSSAASYCLASASGSKARARAAAPVRAAATMVKVYEPALASSPTPSVRLDVASGALSVAPPSASARVPRPDVAFRPRAPLPPNSPRPVEPFDRRNPYE